MTLPQALCYRIILPTRLSPTPTPQERKPGQGEGEKNFLLKKLEIFFSNLELFQENKTRLLIFPYLRFPRVQKIVFSEMLDNTISWGFKFYSAIFFILRTVNKEIWALIMPDGGGGLGRKDTYLGTLYT